MARRLYAAAAVREIERRAIGDDAQAAAALMRAAGAACWREITRRWPKVESLGIVCGGGNNGGDGYVVAELALRAGRAVRLFELAELPGAPLARGAREEFLRIGGEVRPWQADGEAVLGTCDVLVDALFGIGLSRAIDGAARGAIEAINRQGRRRVLAVDVPSGLDIDLGAARGVAVQADVTVTFIARKFGLYSGPGAGLAGEVVFEPLATRTDGDGPKALARLQHRDELLTALSPRRRNAHTGDHGHVLVIGGDAGMGGASLLAARAALRAGAGKTSLATHPDHSTACMAAQPELMAFGAHGPAEVESRFPQADVIALGPGLGQNAWGRSLYAAALASGKPLVIDADALNLLALAPQRLQNAVLTPHPGEAARLLGMPTAAVEADRLAAVHALRDRYGATVVLKGAGTLVGSEAGIVVCPYGNPGMAVGGMGDALTGIVAAFVAQGQALDRAAELGVLAHALAGDAAAQRGERGLLPSDLIEALREVVNPHD